MDKEKKFIKAYVHRINPWQRTYLMAVKVVDKNGVLRTVYIRPGKGNPESYRKKAEEVGKIISNKFPKEVADKVLDDWVHAALNYAIPVKDIDRISDYFYSWNKYERFARKIGSYPSKDTVDEVLDVAKKLTEKYKLKQDKIGGKK